MSRENDLELRRLLEEPPSGEVRAFRLPGNTPLAALLDNAFYPPYAVDGLHAHNCIELGLCVAGRGKIRTRTLEREFGAGALLLVPRGVYHSQQNEGAPMTHWRYLEIDEDVLLRTAPAQALTEVRSLLDAARRDGLFLPVGDAQAAALVETMLERRRTPAGMSAQEESLFVLLLLTMLARDARQSPEQAGAPPPAMQPIEPALLYIREHYAGEIRVGDLAKSCAMSESYFRKVFLQLMGMAPLEYVNRYRIHRAVNLLHLTCESVQNIAWRCGFSSIAAFNRNFKRYAGESPSRWRSTKRTGKSDKE